MATPAETAKTTAGNIRDWCRNYIAGILDMPLSKIDPGTEFDRFGLDSAMAVTMMLELEEHLEIEISPSLLFEYPTIAELADHLADVAGKGRGVAA